MREDMTKHVLPQSAYTYALIWRLGRRDDASRVLVVRSTRLVPATVTSEPGGALEHSNSALLPQLSCSCAKT